MAEALGIRPDQLDPGYDLDWLSDHLEVLPMAELEDVVYGYCAREDWDRVIDVLVAEPPKTVRAFLAHLAWAARD